MPASTLVKSATKATTKATTKAKVQKAALKLQTARFKDNYKDEREVPREIKFYGFGARTSIKCLSNLYSCPVVFRVPNIEVFWECLPTLVLEKKLSFPSAEHAYQCLAMISQYKKQEDSMDNINMILEEFQVFTKKYTFVYCIS
jgi:hypothetical protein